MFSCSRPENDEMMRSAASTRSAMAASESPPRTADATADVADLIASTEALLMKLSEAISEAYFRQAEMVETQGDAPA